MRSVFLLLFFCLPALSYADLVRVGLFSGMSLTGVEAMVAEGNYSLVLPNGRREELKVGTVLTFSLRGTSIQLKRNSKTVGQFNQARLVSLLNDGALRINLAGQPEPNQFTYGGHFEFSVVKSRIRIVNLADLESYVAAVVESEIGANSAPEFLKVQSVLCRTYCLNHLDRHAAEGFQLCDRVHCQAYKGKSRFNKLAEEAVEATRNKVLVDTKNRLIIAAYHSNCGGQTVSAESVWSQPASYLEPVADTFCLNERHAAWNMIMSLENWKSYLEEKGLLDPHADSLAGDSLFEYHPGGRSVYFSLNEKQLPLKTIRENWKLNSTWFDIGVSRDSVQFTGRGFGHGIGLCQEGAMKMADYGKTFSEIIDFYFRDVRLADADALKLWNKQ